MAAYNGSVAVGATSTTVLDVPSGDITPQLIYLTNNSDAVIYVSLGTLNAETGKGIRLAVEGSVTVDNTRVLVNKISAISSGAGKNLCVSYL